MNNLEFIKRIQKEYEGLSPNARKVANYLQHNPLDVLNLSVAEIAEITHTSKATVSRFFRQLGYDSQLDVKKELRQLRNTGYPVFQQDDSDNIVHQEMMRVKQTLDNLPAADLERLAQRIVDAPKVTLIGFRNSYPVAMHFRQQLLQIRPRVRLLPQPGQTLGEELLDIEANELVILVAFRRRPSGIAALIDKLSEHDLVILTDPSAQIYQSKARQLLVCQLGQEMPLDSYAAPMSVVSIVCNRALSKLSQDGSQRIRDISDQYAKLQELEQ